MSDVDVARYRRIAKRYPEGSGARPELENAANEIERLRAERDTLRKALRRIVNQISLRQTINQYVPDHGSDIDLAVWDKIAREALSQ